MIDAQLLGIEGTKMLFHDQQMLNTTAYGENQDMTYIQRCMCLRMWLDVTLSQHDMQLRAGTTAASVVFEIIIL